MMMMMMMMMDQRLQQASDHCPQDRTLTEV